MVDEASPLTEEGLFLFEGGPTIKPKININNDKSNHTAAAILGVD